VVVVGLAVVMAVMEGELEATRNWEGRRRSSHRRGCGQTERQPASEEERRERAEANGGGGGVGREGLFVLCVDVNGRGRLSAVAGGVSADNALLPAPTIGARREPVEHRTT
jgi:hypothetical protein